MTDLPIWLANALGTTPYVAGLLLSCGILMSIGLVTVMIGRKMNLLATAIPMFSAMSFLVAIGWLDFWILMVVAIMVAFMFANSIKSILTGG